MRGWRGRKALSNHAPWSQILDLRIRGFKNDVFLTVQKKTSFLWQNIGIFLNGT